MHYAIVLVVFLSCLPLLAQAEPVLAPTAIPLPTPHLTESTLIQGTGWSGRGNVQEGLACELAENRALAQLKKGITLARTKRLLSPEELSQALPIRIHKRWDRAEGRCIVQLELEVPNQPRSLFTTTPPRQY